MRREARILQTVLLRRLGVQCILFAHHLVKIKTSSVKVTPQGQQLWEPSSRSLSVEPVLYKHGMSKQQALSGKCLENYNIITENHMVANSSDLKDVSKYALFRTNTIPWPWGSTAPQKIPVNFVRASVTLLSAASQGGCPYWLFGPRSRLKTHPCSAFLISGTTADLIHSLLLYQRCRGFEEGINHMTNHIVSKMSVFIRHFSS